ncbi:hypothetical protein IV38_GL001776 [Lactobacillus selangorensis]|uniref:Pyrrolidone-carboxylate peptidase n=1 Tax=Lactobacillus selangorensis TaxID=81857 RepID=A0A0R2FHC5_9LACO|nr:hypothetical protein [Lactobacillus selangorensis]KRN27936.1 hypothetical protein IV38_GL001776 [Lactobacillus selangorensis]KRN30593.1 hypothetical protein IV40_GL001780 [Lactobacillus selangorensis]
MTVLVTGFEPLQPHKLSASWEAVKRLPDKIMGEHISKLKVPAAFNACVAVLADQIAAAPPTLVLNVMAAPTTTLNLIRMAVNLNDSRRPDNAGQRTTDAPITVDGPAAFWSQLPVRELLTGLRGEHLPSRIMTTAEPFLGNHLMYRTQELIVQQNLSCWNGLLQVPLLPEQAVADHLPSMSVGDSVRGLQTALAVAIEAQQYSA